MILFTIALFLVWLVAVVRLDAWREWHHAYIGIVLTFSTTPWVALVGVLILADDAWQHTKQTWEPSYESPLHRLYVWVYRRVFMKRFS